MRTLLLALVAQLVRTEDEGRAALLLHKQLSPSSDFNTAQPINVTITVYNKGPGRAFSLMVTDDNWKPDKFRIIAGGNNFTVDYLAAGDSYEHEFVVKPIKKMWHRVKPAKMFFVDGVEDEMTITHLSNSLPEMRVVVKKDSIEDLLLTIGRFITLGIIQTKRGWMGMLAVAMCLLGIQLHFIGSAVLQKRRHLRALEDVKKL